MSHVTTIDLDVRDLGALALAAARLGLRLDRDVTTYRSYQSGLECVAALTVVDDPTAYQVGVVQRADGRGFDLMWDNFGSSGRALADRVGTDTGLLKQAYSVEVTRQQLTRQGFTMSESRNPQTGAVVLTATGGRGPIGGAM